MATARRKAIVGDKAPAVITTPAFEIPVMAEPPIKAWSFSRWQAFRDCPYKSYMSIVKKFKEPTNAAMSRGSDMHAAMEAVVKKESRVLHAEIDKRFLPDLKAEMKLGAVAEEEWAFTDTWEPTGWFAPDAWCRIKMDLHVLLPKRRIRVTDHKSGKVKSIEGDHLLQLQLYGVGAISMFEGLDEVEVYLWFLDHYVKPYRIWKAKEIEVFRKQWEERVKPMLNTTRFEPTPSANACRFCPHQKARGGSCKY